MSIREFRRAGHAPTLFSAFLYFDISFMVWVILGPLGPFLGEAYKLSATQKGLLTAVPLLGGSFFRLVLGWMTERFGGRKTGLIGMTVTLVPLLAAWPLADSFEAYLAVGLLLGVAGASFAAALPLASGWYPPEHQGLAMGIAGAGNSGTLLATLFAPRLAQAFGWRNIFGMATIPVIAVSLFLAKDAPGARRVKRWSEYAANFTTLVVLSGSFLRPVGGVMADRLSGYRMLRVLLSGADVCLGAVSTLPPAFFALGFLAVGMGMLGMGNGCLFQLLPQRFPDRVGIMTGIVGAAGGFGGLMLPSLLMLCGAGALAYLGRVWRREWSLASAVRAGLIRGMEADVSAT